jgi:hypothetical protein
MPEKLSDDELAERIRNVCRELLRRSDEPDVFQAAIENLGPLLSDETEPPKE